MDFIWVDWKNAFLYSKVKTSISFPDFKSVIESSLKDRNYSMQEVPKNMVSVLERSIMFSGDELDKIITFEVNNKIIKCLTKSSHGNITDYVSFKDSLGEFTVRLDSYLLKDCINSIVRIGFIIGNDSIIILGEDDNYLLLLSSFVDS